MEKASKQTGKVLVGLAIAAICHAAFSTFEYLSTLKALGRPPSTLPTSIIVEAILAFLIFIPGIALATAPLQDVTFRGELAKRSLNEMNSRMGFTPLSSRGRALFGDSIASI